MKDESKELESEVDDWLREWASYSPSALPSQVVAAVCGKKLGANPTIAVRQRLMLTGCAICACLLVLLSIAMLNREFPRKLEHGPSELLSNVQSNIDRAKYEIIRAEMGVLRQQLVDLETESKRQQSEIDRISVVRQLQAAWLGEIDLAASPTYLQLP